MRCDDRRVSGRCGGLAFKCDYKNNTRDDHVQAAFLVGRRSSDGPRLPSAFKKQKKNNNQQFRSNGLVVATGWSLFLFVNNTISSGKSRFVYHKQAVGYARETGHSPQARWASRWSPVQTFASEWGSSFSKHTTTRAIVTYAPNLSPTSWLRSARFWPPSLVPWPGRGNRELLRLQHKA